VSESETRIAPTRNDRPFHNLKLCYGSNAITEGVNSGLLTPDDAGLINKYIAELRVTKGIGDGRTNKIIFTLVTWRKFIGPFAQNSITDLYTGVEALKRARTNGHLYKQNTLRDFLNFIKRFYLWLIESGYSTIVKEKINNIKAPRRDTMTKTAEQLLTEEEVLAMIHACMNSRDRALISVTYEGGFRIQEIGQLTWGQVVFDDYGVIINVNEKTGRPRYVRLISSTHNLSSWRADYPYESSGNALVFMTAHRQPLQYATVLVQLRKIAARAGITKSITPHLFRHSRITHLMRKGYSESIIKKMMWGNISTTMFETYVHLTDADTDAEILEKEGIKSKNNGNSSPMAARQCANCMAVNPPSNNYCSVCGQPLTGEAKRSMDSIMSDIESSPEYINIIKMIKNNIMKNYQ